MAPLNTNNSNYIFDIFWSEEDQAFIGACPNFPGVSAFGDTEEQALAEVNISLKLAIETYEEEGWKLPRTLNRENL